MPLSLETDNSLRAKQSPHRPALAWSSLNPSKADCNESAMRKKILPAEDDEGVRQMLKRVLELEHYAVICAGTGREAAAKFRANPPDLVLLDLNMPDQDGWEAFDSMNDTDPFVPVIVITAKPQQYGRAIEVGVDALMEKPLDLPLLLATIADLLAESEPHRVRRLTDRDFKTTLLRHRVEECLTSRPMNLQERAAGTPVRQQADGN